MSVLSQYDINRGRYDWCVRAFSAIKGRLGINIRVNDPHDAIRNGQILLFNHFARFETVIPQYLVHQATGEYCRCVATHELFANEKTSNFLWSVGAVPNDHEGLLPFLAADILRGHKVVIFPEGGMIKDRNVVDQTGDLGVISPLSKEQRKHHRGAAALALTLSVFKKRILTVRDAGEQDRLQRWADALDLTDVDALIEAARKPTFVVPGNITFYPIHNDDNILRKGAEWVGVELGDQAKEELLIEGNILLKQTDMDVSFGKPIEPVVGWNFMQRMLLKKVFERVDSLDDLFGLRRDSENWVERHLSGPLLRETDALRDVCMEEMYALTTVNLSHLASYLIMRLAEDGVTEIESDRFHWLLFAAIKNAQVEPELNLHPSVSDPDFHENIHCESCDCLEYARFQTMATQSGLIEEKDGSYHFLPKLLEDHGLHEVRLENMISVYANEITPLRAAVKAVEDAIEAEPAMSPADRSFLLFDNEYRAYEMAKRAFSAPEYEEVNARETAMESGAPYLLVPENPKLLGVVLVHGFLSSPAEIRNLGERLSDEGYPVVGVRLKGHGTSPWDLHRRNWLEWLGSAERGMHIMEGLAEKVVLIGFSTGGSLALRLAAERAPSLAGVVSVAGPISFVNRSIAFVPLIHGINKVAEWIGADDAAKPFVDNNSSHPDINYRQMPVAGLRQLQHLVTSVRKHLDQIECPALIMQADKDDVVEAESARIIFDGIASAEKELAMIRSDHHGIINREIGDTLDRISAFVAGLASRIDSASVEAPPVAVTKTDIAPATAR